MSLSCPQELTTEGYPRAVEICQQHILFEDPCQ